MLKEYANSNGSNQPEHLLIAHTHYAPFRNYNQVQDVFIKHYATNHIQTLKGQVSEGQSANATLRNINQTVQCLLYNNKSAAGFAWCPATALTPSQVTVLNLCTSSGHALYLYQVLQNYMEWYQSYRVDMISILKITKGNNSAKNVGGATVVKLCMSPGHALYFYQVLWNYLERYQSYRVDTISILTITKGNNSTQKCRWSDHC